MLVRGWLLLLFTLVQGEHRKYPPSWPLWTQEEKNKPWRTKGTLWSPSCEERWLAGQWAPHLHSSASGSLVNMAQLELSPYPGIHGAEASPSAQKP